MSLALQVRTFAPITEYNVDIVPSHKSEIAPPRAPVIHSTTELCGICRVWRAEVPNSHMEEIFRNSVNQYAEKIRSTISEQELFIKERVANLRIIDSTSFQTKLLNAVGVKFLCVVAAIVGVAFISNASMCHSDQNAQYSACAASYAGVGLALVGSLLGTHAYEKRVRAQSMHYNAQIAEVRMKLETLQLYAANVDFVDFVSRNFASNKVKCDVSEEWTKMFYSTSSALFDLYRCSKA